MQLDRLRSLLITAGNEGGETLKKKRNRRGSMLGPVDAAPVPAVTADDVQGLPIFVDDNDENRLPKRRSKRLRETWCPSTSTSSDQQRGDVQLSSLIESKNMLNESIVMSFAAESGKFSLLSSILARSNDINESANTSFASRRADNVNVSCNTSPIKDVGDDLSAQIEQLQSEVMHLQAELDERSDYAELQTELIAAKEATSALEERVDSLESEKDTIVQQLEVEMGANAEYQKEQAVRLTDLEQRNATLLESFNSSEITCSELQEELSAIKALVQDISLLESDFQAAKDEIDKLNVERIELLSNSSSKDACISSLEEKLDLIVKELASVREEQAKDKAENVILRVTLTETKEELAGLFSEFAEKDAAMESIQQQADSLLAQKKEELAIAGNKLEEMIMSVDRLQDSLSAVTEEKDLLEKQLIDVTNAFTEQYNECTDLRKELEDERTRNVELQDLLENTKGNESEVHVALSKLIEEKNELQQQVNSLQESSASELIQRNEKIDKLSQHIEELSHSISEGSNEIVHLHEQLDITIQNLTEQTSELSHCRDELHQEKVRAEELQTLLNTKESVADETQSILNQLTEERDTLKENLSIVQASVNQLESELLTQREAVASLESALDEANCKSKTVEMEFMEMQEKMHVQLLDAQNECASYANKLATIEFNQTELLTASTSATAAAAVAAAARESMEQRLVEMELLLENTKAEKEVLTKDFKEKEDMLLDLQQQIAAFGEEKTSSTTAMENEIATLREEKKMLSSSISAKDLELQEQTDLIDSLTFKGEEREQLVNNLQQQLEEVKERVSQATEEREQIKTELQSAIKDNETKVAQLIAEKEELEVQLTAECNKNSYNHNSSIRVAELELTQESIDNARKEMERSLSAMHAELGNKEGEISKLLGRVTQLENELQTAKQQIDASHGKELLTDSSEEQTKKRLNQLQTNNNLLLGEKDSLQKQLVEVKAELKTLTNRSSLEIEKLERQINDLSAQKDALEKARGDSRQYEDAINSLKMKNQAIVAELDEAKASVSAILQEKMSLEEELSHRSNDVGNTEVVLSLQHKLDELIEKESSTDALVTKLEEDLHEATTRLKKSYEEKNMYRNEYDNAESKLKLLISERDDLSNELENSLRQINDLTIALEEAEAESISNNNHNNEEELQELQEKLDHAEKSYATLETQLNQITTERDDLKLEMTSLQDSFDNLSNDRDTIIARVTSFEQEVTTMRDRINVLEQENISLQSQVSMSSSSAAEQVEFLRTEMVQLSLSRAELQKKFEETQALVVEYQEKLVNYDKNAAREHELIMKAAELQMNSLQEQMDELTNKYSQSNLLIATLQQSEKDLDQQNNKLRLRILEQEDALAAVENELHELKQDNNSESIELLEEELEKLRKSNHSLEESLRVVQKELVAANEHCETTEKMIESIRVSHEEEIATKETRIAHLEKCKLTKSQMEKIKVLKEEKNKYQDDSKTMKKQLHSLKKAYDELKESIGKESSGPSSDFIVSDLKFQVAELNGQLQQANNVSNSLKEKLKDCSKQLQVLFCTTHYLNHAFLLIHVSIGIRERALLRCCNTREIWC